MRDKTLMRLALFVCLGVLFLRLRPAETTGETAAVNAEQVALRKVRRLLRRNFVHRNLDDGKMLYGALRGLVASLGDRHTVFFPPDRYKSFQAETSGHFGGLGVYIGFSREKGLHVLAVIPDTPAAAAGLRSGDRLMKIDGRNSSEMSTSEASKFLRGPAGSSVRLLIESEGETESREVTVVRARIDMPSVYDARLVKPRKPGGPLLGYIGLSSFQEGSADEVKSALAELRQRGAAGLIMDLRRNGGGILPAAVRIADMFLSSGLIVVQRGRKNGRRRGVIRLFASRQNDDCSLPLVLLVDGGSASASEVLAGALQDHKRAVLVGERTYGKGSVQVVLPFDIAGREAAVKVTTARYYTPSGRSVEGKAGEKEKGLPVDYEVSLDDDMSARLERRIAYLRLARMLDRPPAEVKRLMERDEEKPAAGEKTGPKEKLEKTGALVNEKDKKGGWKVKKKGGENGAGSPGDEEPFVDVQLQKALEVLRKMVEAANGRGVKKGVKIK